MKTRDFIKFIIPLIFFFYSCDIMSPSKFFSEFMKFLSESEKKDFKIIKEDIEKNFAGYSNLKDLLGRLNHRMAGTENGKKAEEFVFNKLREYGMEAYYDPFKFKLWKRKAVSLCVNTPDKVEMMDSVSLAYTPILSDVKAPIYDVGDGLDADFKAAGADLKGRIALINHFIHGPKMDKNNKKVGNPHRSKKAEWAYKAGALGVIFVNKYEGNVLLTGTANTKENDLIKIPALCVSIEDGRRIRGALSNGDYTEAHIQVKNEVQETEARNVIGRIKGLEIPDERVIIGGHLDSWDLGQGAIDNGFGSFTILDIARVYSGNFIPPRRSIEFIFWMGEEHGLLGSKSFMKKEVEKGSSGEIRYYINIDMQGNPRGFNLEGREEMAGFLTKLGEKIQATGADFLNLQESKPTMDAYSDDVIFSIQGIPVLQQMSGLDSGVYAWYHSNRDNFNLVNEGHMKNTAFIMSLTLYRIANSLSIPATVLSIEETRKFFQEHGGMLVLAPEFNWDLRIKKGPK